MSSDDLHEDIEQNQGRCEMSSDDLLHEDIEQNQCQF